MSSSSESKDEEQYSREKVVKSIYAHLLRSVVVGYASNMHELIKTGGISAFELKTPSSRQEIFPSLYEGKTQEEIQSSLDQYATEIPARRQSRKRKLSQSAPNSPNKKETVSNTETSDAKSEIEKSSANEGVDPKDHAGERTPAAEKAEETKEGAPESLTPATNNGSGPTASSQPSSGFDLWGRFPPKEPKLPVECTLCGRLVSTMRFASHLEKCMGLSTRPSTGVPIRSTSTSISMK